MRSAPPILVEMSSAEALHVLKLLDADHAANGTPLSKETAKKVWAHLVDAGVLKDPKGEVR